MKNKIKSWLGFSTSTTNAAPKEEKMDMFCFQCEQAANGGCSKVGVCGKQPDVAALQDLLVYTMKGIAFWADKAREKGAKDTVLDHFMIDGLFTTVTNVAFDAEEIAKLVRDGAKNRDRAQALFEKANGGPFTGIVPEAAQPFQAGTTAELAALGARHGVKDDSIDPDVKSVQEIIIYGMKGYAAYAHHALVIGLENDEIYAFTYKGLAATLDKSLGLMDFVGLSMECGRINLVTMELLDKANTDSFGHPVPTPVALGTKAGKAILVSGHDLRMLEELLKQTEGKGINIYTHGEMLPAHGYPGL